MSTRLIVEIALTLIMVGGIYGIFAERKRAGRGIGVRIIQFSAVLLVVPAIVILALEGVLESEVVGTLLGAVLGYVLSGIGKDEPS